ncbi:hypothetical protein KSP39_PZI020273 [Platanthera zijinensis]|uniref:Reverse transcriptase/retrotransposon-derived protein RNase H-like domain-containing protein n=1 Tax=Platanthera zijinensis TaxID=2320716 RepID=A0AAP0AZR0_9ASPA
MIVETDASDIGYGGILKQRLPPAPREYLVRYHSGIWIGPQKHYYTIKKEILSIVKSAKYILQNDVQNLVSKQIFARWQAILSVFDFDIEYVKGSDNSLPDFLTREFLQGNEQTTGHSLDEDSNTTRLRTQKTSTSTHSK